MNIKLPDYKDKPIHFIGIGGCSMSGLAQILAVNGYKVTGSDARESAFTKQLEKHNIHFSIGKGSFWRSMKSPAVITAICTNTN